MSLQLAIDDIFTGASRGKEAAVKKYYKEKLENSGIAEKYIIKAISDLELKMDIFFDFPTFGKILREATKLMQKENNKYKEKELEVRDKKFFQPFIEDKTPVKKLMPGTRMLKDVSPNDLHVSGEELQRIKQRVKKGF